MTMQALMPSLGTYMRGDESAPVPWSRNGSQLANSLVGFWPLDEVSGTRRDIIGTSTLTDNNTVTSAAGISYPLAAEFVIANSESLSAADSAVLSAGNIKMWGCGWLRPAAVNVTSTVAGKWNTSGNREWQVAQVNTDLIFQVSPDGTATANGAVTASGVLIANTWCAFMWYHDPVADLIALSVNAAPWVTAAYSGTVPNPGIWDSAASFRIGGQGAGTSFFGGRIQSIGLGKGYVPALADAASFCNDLQPGGVRNIYCIGYGREVDWSPNGQQLAFDRRDTNGIYQLHVSNADGSNVVNISNPAVGGGPAIDRHKGFPAWHPSGNYIVASVEMATHNAAQSLSEPGRGGQCNVWICTPDGQQWWQMTNYSTTTSTGVLNPRFNRAGTKLLWASKIGGVVNPTAPFASWQLQLADFTTPAGVPTLSNITTLTPGSKLFYESQGFSRDDLKLVYTADSNAGSSNVWGPDVYLYTISGGALVNLTSNDVTWEEHGSYAPHADYVAFLSSRSTAYTSASGNANALAGELFISKSDGTDKRQITHFNQSGFLEYNAERSVATVNAWSPDGTKIAVAQLLLGATYDLTAGGLLWIVEFNGPYA